MSTSKLRLRIFDGTRQLFAAPAKFFVNIIDGNQGRQVWKEYTNNDISFDLPFFDNLGISTPYWCQRRGISRLATLL